MKLVNLKTCYVYKSSIVKYDGEINKQWIFKDKYKLNVQQDISELDRTEAGIINYDKIKIRFDYDVPIDKGDGISLISDNCIPEYVVTSKTKVGKCTTCICEVNHR